MTRTIDIYIRGDPAKFTRLGLPYVPFGFSEVIQRFKEGEGRLIKPRNLPPRINPQFKTVNVPEYGINVFAQFIAASDDRADERLKSSPTLTLDDVLHLLAILRRGTDKDGRLRVPPEKLVPYLSIIESITASDVEKIPDPDRLNGEHSYKITGPLYDFIVANDIVRLLKPFALNGNVQYLRPEKNGAGGSE
jgi:hypothetical protein